MNRSTKRYQDDAHIESNLESEVRYSSVQKYSNGPITEPLWNATGVAENARADFDIL